MKKEIAMHAERAAEKLRQKHLRAGCVGVWIQTPYYDQHVPQHNESRFIGLPRSTLDTALIIKTAHKALEQVFKAGYGYNKAMVLLGDLVDADIAQGDLISLLPGVSENDAKRKSLMELIDRTNRVEGRGTLQFAAQGLGPQDWHMVRRKLSPCWTTDWHDMLVIGDLSCEQRGSKEYGRAS